MQTATERVATLSTDFYRKSISEMAWELQNADYIRHIYLFTKATYEREQKGGVSE